jgi:hypothetical protein
MSIVCYARCSRESLLGHTVDAAVANATVKLMEWAVLGPDPIELGPDPIESKKLRLPSDR